MASMEVRSDGSVVAFYLGQEKIHYSVRTAEDEWSPVGTIDAGHPPNQAGPQAVLGKEDVIHLAYYGTNGTVWYRQFLPDGTLTPRQLLAGGAGKSRADGATVYGYIYDAGSDGGAGMNRFGEIVLQDFLGKRL